MASIRTTHQPWTVPIQAAAAALGVPLAAGPAAPAEDRLIVVQSTTSTQNSGLFDAILPKFKQETGIEVRVVAVGTGRALENARKCEGDVLLVHAEPAEIEFVEDGFGVERFDVMHNDFVIVGPAADPAKVRGTSDAAAALEKIAAAKAPFVSRGEDSGTHKKELSLWKDAGVDPTAAGGDWYRETGTGMGATLATAVGTDAYTLTDRGTWISLESKGDLEVLVEGDDALFNQYGVIRVSPKHCPGAKAEAAQKFVDWITGPGGQQAIADYKRNGQQLFFPDAKGRS